MDEIFMRAAIHLAMNSLSNDDLPVGAVAVLHERVVGMGARLPSLNPQLDHAEIQAMRSAMTELGSYNLKEVCIYTTLEPCIMCFGTILNCRIKRVVYAMEDPYGGAAGISRVGLPLRHQVEVPEVVGGVLHEEARRLFQKFFETSRNEFWRKPNNPLVQACMRA